MKQITTYSFISLKKQLHSLDLSLNANKPWLQKINKTLTFLVCSSDGSSSMWISCSHELLCFVNRWWSPKAVNGGRVCCVGSWSWAWVYRSLGFRGRDLVEEATLFFPVQIHGYGGPFILTLLGFLSWLRRSKGVSPWKSFKVLQFVYLIWRLIW